MSSSESSPMGHLIQARNAALENVSLYPEVMAPILGLITDNASLELRRWVADFLAEALASPTLPSEKKQQMITAVLPSLKRLLELPNEDVILVKSVIQASASIYPLVFRHIIDNPNDAEVWQSMASIKSNILRRMDSSAPGIRICCIKFVQRVVHTQTPGVISDPRRPEQNEVSLALVPSDHPLIPPSNLEAETHGLLDRLLGIIQDNTSDTLLVTATLNSLGALIRTRPTIANKIVNAVLMFNPLSLFVLPITAKTKILLRSLERTVRVLLHNVLKRTPNHPMAGRMQAYIDRLQQARLAFFEEAKRKRPAPADLADKVESSKRQQTDPATAKLGGWTVPTGPVSVSELFALTEDPGARNFDVQNIPADIVAKILIPILQSIDRTQMENAINIVRARHQAVAQAQAAQVPGDAEVDEDEDYEPDYQPTEDMEQIRNRLEMESSEDLGIGIPKPSQISQRSLGPFSLPAPQPLSDSDLQLLSSVTMDQVFNLITHFQRTGLQKPQKAGFQRLAGSAGDQQALVTEFARLITRPSSAMMFGLNGKAELSEHSKGEKYPNGAHDSNLVSGLCDRARQQLLQYILNDWRHRMDIATAWLTEEWYNDKVVEEAWKEATPSLGTPPPQRNFNRWVHNFLDDLAAFIGSEQNKLLIRFLSELPGVDRDIVEKVKRLANDPERLTLVVSTLHFLALFRPPVKEVCVDALEDLWLNYDGAKGPTTPLLKKFRPQVLEGGEVKQEA